MTSSRWLALKQAKLAELDAAATAGGVGLVVVVVVVVVVVLVVMGGRRGGRECAVMRFRVGFMHGFV